MKVTKNAPGTTLPPWTRQLRSTGRYLSYWLDGQLIVRSWPRKIKRELSPDQIEHQNLFKRLVTALKDVMPIEQVGAREIAYGSKYIWRDVLARAMCGELVELENYAEMVSQYNLDILGTEPGMIVIRSETWIALPKDDDGKVLKMVAGLPAWADAAEGITELIGDIIAGPGTGTQTATLSDTAVTPGTYTLATITVDSKGRITDADDGSVSGAINQLTGDVLAGPGSGSQTATLSTTGVAAGTYSPLAATVDAKGRITAASTASLTAYINQLTGDVTAGPGSGSQSATLANTGVAAGTYSNATVTFDAKGRATSAADGTAGYAIDRYHPGMINSRLYLPPMAVALISGTLAGNILYSFPVYIPQTATLDTLRFQVNGANTATLAECGIYSNNNGLPDSLLHDCGTISVTTGGTKTFTSIGQAVSPGWYWIALALNGTCTISNMSSNGGQSSTNLGIQALTAGSFNYGHVRGAWTFSAGNLPATFPSPTPDNNVYPAVAFTLT